MAGAKPGVHVVQLKPISVPKSLQEGAKFVKWDEDSTVGTPVTLRVDSKGFFLYWTDQNKETELLEINCIRDTRTGKYARVPKDPKLRDTVNMGAPDTPLEDKTVTVVHGTDLVNISFINFCCNARELAKEWTDELMKMAYNLLALNASAMTYLEKAYTKMTVQTYKDGKIPVKNIVRMFAKNQEDKRRVEKALEAAGYAASKTDTIDPSKFTFEDFFSFYKNLTGRQEVEKIFDDLCGGAKKKNNYLTAEQFVKFLNDTQRDPRLNEILYQFATVASIKEIINQYEPAKSLAKQGLLSFEGFLRYLMSDDNAIMAPEKYDLSNDMNQPLSHYFINSSHNTYLTGHQLTGKSSVEMYRQCLLSGCRCVELDCWNGRTSEEEPIITHGYTVVTDINFKEVVDAIAECAFKTSEYPVILSFENHCSAKQQAKMATYCTKVFGDMLLSEPIPTHPVAPGAPLPSPNQLLRKIIIKNKKKHYHRGSGAHSKVKKASSTSSPSGTAVTPSSGGGSGKPDVPRLQKTNSKDSSGEPAVNGDETAPNGDLKDFDSSSSSDEDDDGSGTEDPQDSTTQEQGTASQESEAGAELSALVNYIQPVHFHGFEGAEKRNRSYEISSFVETVATALLKERPVEFVNYNKRQLSRLYPKGTRVDSSNYMPQVFWNAGCQLVALNFQTLDLALQLNLGIFEYNARSGYLLKPDFMRRHDRRFDPFAESTVDGIIAGTLHVQIISGMFLSDKRVGTYVEVESYGLPTDTFRKKFRTKVVQANGINPVYDEAPFILKKVVLPELAVLRIAVYEEGGKMIGHRILPIVGLRPGYRHIGLRNESGQPLTLPVIFVHIIVKDYVPDDLSKFAEALANPIEYTARIKERARMLDKLLDSDDEDQGDKPQQSPCLKPGGPLTPVKTTPQKICSFERTGSVKEGMNGSPLQVSSPKVGVDLAGRSSRISVTQSSSQSESTAESKPAEVADVVLVAESLEKIKQDSKLVQSVISKLEKDLQALRKKHDKAVSKEQEMKQQKEEKLTQPNQEKKSTLAKTHSRLFKKLSKTNVEVTPPKKQSDVDLGDVADHATKLQELHRTHSQSILSLFKDHYLSDLELKKKYHDPLYIAIEKAMQTAQAAQMKELQTMHENDKADLLKGLDTIRSDEIKNLKKNPRDKNEFNRMKREIYQKHIDLAVSEIQKLNDVFEKKKKDLEVQHEEVKKKFEEEKAKALEKLQRDYEEHCQRLPQECSALLSMPDVPAPSKDITSL